MRAEGRTKSADTAHSFVSTTRETERMPNKHGRGKGGEREREREQNDS